MGIRTVRQIPIRMEDMIVSKEVKINFVLRYRCVQLQPTFHLAFAVLR